MAIVETTRSVDVETVEAKKPFQKKAIERFLRSDIGHRVVHGLIARIFEYGPSRLFKWEGLENLDAIEGSILRGEKVLVAPNHISHADGVPITKLLVDIRDLVPGAMDGVVYTMAGSMKTGEQGLLIQTMFEYGVGPYFARNGINPDYVVSKNDRKERGMTRPADNGKITAEALLDPRKLSAVHLEGRTQGGKTNSATGKLFGLQPLDIGSKIMLRDQLNSGLPTVIFPVMIEGTETLFDPNSKDFKLSSINELLEMLTIGEGTHVGQIIDVISKLWFEDTMRDKPGTVKLGEPKMLSEIHTCIRDLGDNVMRLNARLASPRYLGDYGRFLLAS